MVRAPTTTHVSARAAVGSTRADASTMGAAEARPPRDAACWACCHLPPCLWVQAASFVHHFHPYFCGKHSRPTRAPSLCLPPSYPIPPTLPVASATRWFFVANPADLTEIDPPNFKFKESDLTVTVRSRKTRPARAEPRFRARVPSIPTPLPHHCRAFPDPPSLPPPPPPLSKNVSAVHAQLYVRCENDGNIGTLKYRTQSYNGAIGGAAGCPGGACDFEEQPEQSIVCVSSGTYQIFVNFKEDDKYEEDQTVGLVLTRSIGSNIVPFAGVAARMTIQDDGDGTWDSRMQERGCGDEVCVCGGGGYLSGPVPTPA